MKQRGYFTTMSQMKDGRRSDEDELIEAGSVDIPMEELRLFADRLLQTNSPKSGPAKANSDPTSVAKKILSVRTEISGILAALDLPISPVLDMLLDLFTNEKAGRRVSVSDVAIAGHCPLTTGLRWVVALTDAGLIERTNDISDHRRTYISLTDQGRHLVLRCIEAHSAN